MHKKGKKNKSCPATPGPRVLGKSQEKQGCPLLSESVFPPLVWTEAKGTFDPHPRQEGVEPEAESVCSADSRPAAALGFRGGLCWVRPSWGTYSAGALILLPWSWGHKDWSGLQRRLPGAARAKGRLWPGHQLPGHQHEDLVDILGLLGRCFQNS